MLSTLPTLKSRLAIPDLNVEFDDLLTTALTALSARFDNETNRALTRTANTTHEFDACETEIIPPRDSEHRLVSKYASMARTAKLWFVAFALSLPLVALTLIIPNPLMAVFPTHDPGLDDIAQISGHGLPLAFRETLFFIDTSTTSYHWWIFTLDVALSAALIFLLLRRSGVQSLLRAPQSAGIRG